MRYGIYFLAWTAAGLFYFSQELALRLYRTDPTPWQHVLFNWMAGMYVSAALTPLLLWAGARWPIELGNRIQRGILHLLFASLFALAEIVIETPILMAAGTLPAPLRAQSYSGVLPVLLVYTFHGNVIRYFVVLAAQAAFRYYRKYRERESAALRLELQTAELAAQLSGAQLRALKMQLQPHFLFNTLGAIVVLVRKRRTEQAEEMLAKLSELLRLVLDDVEAQEIPLSRELEYLRLYLDIESVRFPDRLRVRFQYGDSTLNSLIPPMALQPIVENAVKHGLGRSTGVVTIDIAAHAGPVLTLTVTDDGPGLPEADSARRGIGLANTRARLERLYGAAAVLTVENRDGGGVAATMTLPFRLAAGESA
ncbi:MAG: histidine kinase [Acidobacteria bacterium]|nr:histidine kinase [Acidobacteriota bacterium]